MDICVALQWSLSNLFIYYSPNPHGNYDLRPGLALVCDKWWLCAVCSLTIHHSDGHPQGNGSYWKMTGVRACG